MKRILQLGMIIIPKDVIISFMAKYLNLKHEE
jgi:hypothetical protein